MKIAIIDNKPISDNNIRCLSHADVCAAIIKKNYPFAEFRYFDISFDEKAKTSIDCLILAIKKCIYENIKIINLSIGTINYFDGVKLIPWINKLIDNGAFVVAAYSNTNVITYPASIEGVIGVRQDKLGILKENEYTICKQEDLDALNCVIAHNWDYVKTNSFAAPVVTGVIASLLDSSRGITTIQLCEKFKRNAKKINYPIKIKKNIKIYEEITTPIIEIEVANRTKDLFDNFVEKGYAPILIDKTKIICDRFGVLPTNIYGSLDSNGMNMLKTLDYIYRPGVFFIDRYQKKMNKSWQSDVYVHKINNDYILKKDGRYIIVNSLINVITKIEEWFA